MTHVILVRESKESEDWRAHDDVHVSVQTPLNGSFSELMAAVRSHCPDRRWSYFESWEA